MTDAKNVSAVQRVISFMAEENRMWKHKNSGEGLVAPMVEAIYTLKTKE